MTNILKKFNFLISEAMGEKYEDATIAIVAGSFKPPHRGHWNMIETVAKEADMTKVFVSNLTVDLILSRPIKSKSIKEYIFDIQKQLKKENEDNKDFIKRIDIVFNKIKNLSDDEFTLKNVKDILTLTDEEIGMSSFMQEKVNMLQNNMFESLSKHSLDGTYETTLTPETSMKIFEIYNSHNNDNIEILLADGDYKEYPMLAALSWVNENCKNCRIILCSSDKDRDKNNRWNSLDIDLHNKDKNGNSFDLKNIKSLYIMNQILSSEHIRKSIQNGEWSNDWVPEFLSDDEIDEVRNLILQVSKKDNIENFI